MINTRNIALGNEDFSITPLKVSDVNWYLGVIYAEFFSEFILAKPISNKAIVKARLTSLALEYSLGNLTDSDIRLIIRHRDKRIGGVTLMGIANNNGKIELAYWVLPEYQGLGVAKSALTIVENYIKNELSIIKKLELEIMKNNVISIKLAKSQGFKQTDEKDKTFIFTKKHMI